MKDRTRCGCLVGLSVILFAANAFAQGMVVSDLRCEHIKDPLGMETAKPRLSWLLKSDQRCRRQTAYRVLAASSRMKLDAGEGDLWDSGKVKSDRSHLVPYTGKKLSSHQPCFWKVRIWDADNRPTPWSPPARWTMGILSIQDWRASWIAATLDPDPASQAAKKLEQSRLPIFRREFRLKKSLRRAVVYACGLGHYELYLNGSKVGERLLDPPWTNYRRKCVYATYEITDMVRAGDNALGVMLGNGMYNVVGGRYTKFRASRGQPQFILHLRLEYDDGTLEHITSDSSWKVAEGPITFSCVFGGEDWDARLEPAGWLKTGFDDRAWPAAIENAGPQGKLRTTIQPPVKAMRVFKPVTINETDKGVSIDFGQNSAAIPVLRLRGPCGSTVKVRVGEGPTAGGWDNTWFEYTLRGGGEEQFRPRFTSWGCRSILVEGATLSSKATDKPVVLDAHALSLRCGSPLAGSFACSDKLLNKIYHIVLWSIHSNYQSVLTDCPHREKLGWQEVSHLMGPSIHFIYNAAGFYGKIIDDCAEAQTADGLVPDIAPEYVVFGGGFRDSPEWGSAFIINPHLLYLWTGDDAPIAKHYEAMKRYLAYLRSKSKDHILSHGLGDWLPREKTPGPLVATAIYYRDLVLMADYASRLGKR
ncbi:MAG: family 78 glycoside hydrolase catalytic domain, partial [Planctomycetota bacterium]|nr:family 78 glycoside hydrolase catalytic domain [Planctomycetota bacterium]